MPDSPYNDVKREAAELINQKRIENGESSIVFDDKLAYVADIRASELAISYQNARPDGSSCATLLRENNIGFAGFYQHIMESHTTASSIANVVTNKSNYLNSSYSRIGIGCYDNGTLYWVVLMI